MAESPDTPSPGAQPQGQPPRLMIQTQYVKDLSFENPRAPLSFDPNQGRPEIQVRVDVQAQPGPNDTMEVTLKLNVDAKVGDQSTFVLELAYAGLFTLLNIPEQSRQAILLIECPRLIFPFARRIVADCTRDGGFPPLMIDPVDFAALYRRRLQAAQAQAQARNQGEAIPDPTVGNGPN